MRLTTIASVSCQSSTAAAAAAAHGVGFLVAMPALYPTFDLDKAPGLHRSGPR